MTSVGTPLAAAALTHARILRAEVIVTDRADVRATAVVTVDPAEEVFEGHYPGFAILPGVCVVEIVMRAAAECLPEPGLDVSTLESIRFLHPVYPGDELTVSLTWSADGTGNHVLRSVVHCGETTCVRARLRYAAKAVPA